MSLLMPAEVRNRHGGETLYGCDWPSLRGDTRANGKHKLLRVRRPYAECNLRLQTIDSFHF